DGASAELSNSSIRRGTRADPVSSCHQPTILKNSGQQPLADQAVEIVDYDPVWAERFTEQQARLSVVLAPWLAGPIEHIGSTSVPGLRAKPIVDMLAPVTSLADAEATLPELAREGWLFWPDDPNRHYRLWFLR